MASLEEVVTQLQALSPEDKKRAVSQLGLAERIVVESSTTPKPRKLRFFSGKSPVPSGEVDFETWKLLAKQLVEDVKVVEEDKKRTLYQNLLRPALDLVKSQEGTAKELYEVLDKVYGSVDDGQDLLIKFHTSYQEAKESSSEFVQRLYSLCMEAAEKGGATVASVPKLLLKQFIRGGSDDTLMLKLKLEDKLEDPPSFGNLLLAVRTEESKAVEKRLRLKASSKVSSTVVDSENEKRLKDKIKSLEAQLQQHQASSMESSKSVSRSTPNSTSSKGAKASGFSSSSNSKGGATSRKVKVGKGSRPSRFCYRCGEDGHHIGNCSSPKNPQLVQSKLEKRFTSSSN